MIKFRDSAGEKLEIRMQSLATYIVCLGLCVVGYGLHRRTKFRFGGMDRNRRCLGCWDSGL
jgi:hypothetical protein